MDSAIVPSTREIKKKTKVTYQGYFLTDNILYDNISIQFIVSENCANN